jgi:thioredoxin reductase (NADPH)
MSKPTILLVDDDPQVLAAIRRDVRARYRSEYSVLSTASGEEALPVVRELKARGDELALTISDQRMPGIQGVELLSAISEIYPVARRVLLTAYSDIDAVVRGINEAHVHHYLTKPWDPPDERLYPVIDDLLDSWQADRLPEAAGLRVVGYQWSPRSHTIKDFLLGNLIPYRWLDVERDAEARTLLQTVGVTTDELPVVVLEDGSVLRNPDSRAIAERLGLPLQASHELYDLVVAGAGPAGLGAAVYAASEGLRTLLLDRHAPGGQAGTSSRIENYLGFPAGVSGSELTRRAVLQAQRLGAEFVAPAEATGVSVEEGGYKRVFLGDGRHVLTRALLVVSGMTYREHPAEGIAQHTGAGVYYGAAASEAQAFRDGRVMVIGGGNSAGQCAMYLARYAAEAQIVVRGSDLTETMSRYLIDQIEATPNIRLRVRTELERAEGSGRLERVTLRCTTDGSSSVEKIDAVFIMIGTRPHTEWLPDTVLRDEKGFVLCGRDLSASEAFPRLWKEPRDPLLLETSVPGIFAAGDARAGAMNRVASAVGEGAMSVRLVHEYLALT